MPLPQVPSLPMKNLDGEFQQLVSDSDRTESTGMIEKLIN